MRMERNEHSSTVDLHGGRSLFSIIIRIHASSMSTEAYSHIVLDGYCGAGQLVHMLCCARQPHD